MDIEKLILISGPPCSGKTTVIEQLKDGVSQDLASCLGIADTSKWNFFERNDWDRLIGSNSSRLVYENNFLHYFKIKELYHLGNDDWLKLLSNSKEISFVTMWTSPQILQKRIKLRKKLRRSGVMRSSKFLNIFKIRQRRDVLIRFNKLEKFYNTSKVHFYYKKWFEFCDGFEAVAHWVVDTSGSEPQIYERAEWLKRSEQNLVSVS
jgi:hypothetical protein